MLTKEGKYIDGYQGVRPKLPPLGLAYLAGFIEKGGHQVKIIDGMAEMLSAKEIARISNEFDIIGVTSITFLALLAHEVAKEIKQEDKDKPVIFGGPHATVVPEDVLSDENIDYVVLGEGENTFAELVEVLASKKDVSQVRGLAFRKNGKVIFTEPRETEKNIDNFPFPARHLLKMHLYRSSEVRSRRHPALHQMSSRGCPFNCSFCSNKIMHRCQLRMHSPERVVEEMQILIKDYGAKEIHFWDDCFVFDEARALKICEMIQRKNVRISWDCEATINRVTPPILKELKKAGCFNISYGIESGSENRLRELGKAYVTQEKVKQVVKWTREAGLSVRGYFMFGFVGETKEEMEETIKFGKELNLDFATFSLLVPLPGCKDYERAKKEGSFDPYYWKKMILSEISFPLQPVYVPKGITAEQLLAVHRRAFREFYFRPKVILKKLYELRSLSNLIGSIKGAYVMLKKSNK